MLKEFVYGVILARDFRDLGTTVMQSQECVAFDPFVLITSEVDLNQAGWVVVRTHPKKDAKFFDNPFPEWTDIYIPQNQITGLRAFASKQAAASTLGFCSTRADTASC